MTLRTPVLEPDHVGSEYNYKKHLLLLERPCVRCRFASKVKRQERKDRHRKWEKKRSDENCLHCDMCGGYLSTNMPCKRCARKEVA